MLLAAGSDTASAAPIGPHAQNGAEVWQPLEQAAEERWLAYVAEQLTQRR